MASPAKSRDLTTGSIPGHYRALAVPTAIGMMFVTLYNVVDVFYAGVLSTTAQAGLAISFPTFFILMTIGFGINGAMGALIGNALGQKDMARARQIAHQGLSYALIATVVAGILGYVFAPSLIGLISEPGPYRDAAIQYIRVLLLGLPGFLIAIGANGILVAQGDTVSMQRAQIVAFFANLVLCPLFIWGLPGLIPGIGFNGIALSTVASQSAIAIWILSRILRSEVMRHDAPATYRANLSDFRAITGQAVPTAFTMMVMMIAGFVVQYFLKDFGGSAVAAYGVALRVEQLILLPAFGLTGALLPIAAQNYGAGDFDRVREAAWFCFKAGTLMMVCGALILWLFGGMAMALFSDDPEVVRIGKTYLNVDGFLLPIYVMLFAFNALLQAFKKPMWSLVVGIYRQGLGVFLFAWLFVRVFDMGVWGIWFGIAVAVTSGFVVSAIIVELVARPLVGGILARPQKAASNA